MQFWNKPLPGAFLPSVFQRLQWHFPKGCPKGFPDSTLPVLVQMAAVSYTHLDVYKGQAQARTGQGMRETSHMVEAINEMSLALEKEEKQKRQITSDVAHELRTPLTNLQSHMEAMIDGIWDPTSERLKSCHAEILRLVRIVEQPVSYTHLT